MDQLYVDFIGRGRVILVNDNYTGSWIWEKVTPLLQRLGYDVDAVELKNGSEAISKLVDSSKDKVSLVGHGDGGKVINRYINEYGAYNLEAVIYIESLDKETPHPSTWPKGRKLAYDIAYPDMKLIERRLDQHKTDINWSWKKSEYPEQYYILCSLDEIATYEDQLSFMENAGIKEAYELECTHFPQEGRVTELCYIIHRIICRIHGEKITEA